MRSRASSESGTNTPRCAKSEAPPKSSSFAFIGSRHRATLDRYTRRRGRPPCARALGPHSNLSVKLKATGLSGGAARGLYLVSPPAQPLPSRFPIKRGCSAFVSTAWSLCTTTISTRRRFRSGRSAAERNSDHPSPRSAATLGLSPHHRAQRRQSPLSSPQSDQMIRLRARLAALRVLLTRRRITSWHLLSS